MNYNVTELPITNENASFTPTTTDLDQIHFTFHSSMPKSKIEGVVMH